MVGFLAEPPATDDVRQLHAEDVDELGYVMTTTRLWSYQPRANADLFALMRQVLAPAGLDARQRAVLVAACASAYGDAYCALSWGVRLADATDADLAAAVLRGDDTGLDPAERALARWARATARDPNATTAAGVQALRDAGFGDAAVFAITAFVALRLAFSTVNDALGARPDAELAAAAPAAVRAAVTFGRSPR
jgi:alkylhydroperoxidase family enzyme